MQSQIREIFGDQIRMTKFALFDQVRDLKGSLFLSTKKEIFSLFHYGYREEINFAINCSDS